MMKFLPLMELFLMHSFYTDGRCPDFVVTPTRDTQKLFKNHRCVLKPLVNGVRVLMAVTGEGAPFIPLREGVKFTFHLRLQNSDLALFTDISGITPALAPTYTNAKSAPGDLVQLKLEYRRTWSSESFVVQQPAQKDRFTLSGRPLAGLEVDDLLIEGLGAVQKPQGYDATAKRITVNSTGAGAGDRFQVRYESAPLVERGVFADVAIHYNDSLPEIAAGPGKFQLTFEAKSARWAYYVISDRNGASFQITDQDTPPLVFSAENRTDLGEQPDPADDVAQTLAAQYASNKLWRFVSDDPVPCQQRARKSIQLCLDGNQVMAALPNPSPRNYATIQVNGQKEDILFQIVKYLTHQFRINGG